MVDAALRLRLVTTAALHALLKGPGSVAARQKLLAADGRSGSPIESVARLGLQKAGFTVVPQVYIPGVGRVDLLIDGWLVVELDGFAFHAEREHYREDRRRANALTAQGYVLLRFSFEDVMSNLDGLVAAVRATYANGR